MQVPASLPAPVGDDAECSRADAVCCALPLLLPAGLGLPAGGLPWLAIVALLAVPGFLVKQVVNVIQLRTAAQQLVLYDQQQEVKKARQ